ncbi:MAG: sugar phosphate isomerase/epimerase family protein [Candidatus Anstonellales archaeon]
MNNPRNDLLKEVLPIIEYFDYLELTIEPPKAYPIKKSILKELKSLISSYEVKIVAHLPWHFHLVYPLKDIEKKYLEYFKSCILLATDLNAEFITIHPEFLAQINSDRKKFIEELKYSLSDLNDFCKSNGIKLHLENFISTSYSIDEFYEIVNEVDLSITFDIGHANVAFGFFGIKTFLDVFNKRIRHFHVHDNFGERDSHLPVFVGNIDWQRVMVLILEKSKEREDIKHLTFTLEIHSHAKEYLYISKKKLEQMVMLYNDSN